MNRFIEEMGKVEFDPLWDDGLELRRQSAGEATEFRLLLGGVRVGMLRCGDGSPEIEADSKWGEFLLREVLGEWRRQEDAAPSLAA
jgi:hypothetical protein